jgi:hypothetical protein
MYRGDMKKLIALSAIALSIAACGGKSLGPQPSASTTTAMPASEKWFRVTWTVDKNNRLSGYVQNEYGSPMARVQLLAQALDAKDAVLAQKIVFVPGTLAPFTHAPFEIAGLPAADHYKVSVWAFDVIQAPRFP